MSARGQFTIDPVVASDTRFISDPKIKQLLTQKDARTQNPNPQKYADCEIKFVSSSLNYAPALKTIKPFDYDRTLDAQFEKNRYTGPFEVLGENSVYVGQMRGDVREGRGMSVFADGNIYEGYFESDRTSIRGRLLFDNGDVFMGEIRDMCMNGQGVYFNNSLGSKYTGMFVDDAPHGQGREEWEDGTQYEGLFKFGSKEGRGVFRTKEGSIYEGEFRKGRFEGEGTLTTMSKTKYKGTWKAAELQSPAEIVYDDGKVYIGEVNKEMKPHGRGKIESHKKTYFGNFKNGSLDGHVETIYASGEKKTSLYDNGTFVRWLDGAAGDLETDKNEQDHLELGSPLKKPDKKPNLQSGGSQAMANPQTIQSPQPRQPASDKKSLEASKGPELQAKKKVCFCC